MSDEVKTRVDAVVAELEAIPSYKTSGTMNVTVSVPLENPPSKRRDAPGGPPTNNLYFWGTWSMCASSTNAFKGWNPGGVSTQDSQAPASFPGTQTKVDTYQETKHVPTAAEPYFGIVTKVFPNQGNNTQPTKPYAANLYQRNATGTGFTAVSWPVQA